MRFQDTADGCCNFFGFPTKHRLVQPLATAPSVAEVESELTKHLTHMQIDERERILEDLHGIVHVAEEVPEMVERALRELDLELERKKRGTTYELAQSLNREYVANRKLRLQFLRADEMDPPAAADRLIKFFENKRSLFGLDLLTKDVRLKDLDEYDMEALSSGFSQLAPEKDRAGRPVILFVPALASYHAMENMMRAHFYFFMSFLEDEDVQRRGITGLTYVIGNPNVDGHMFWNVARMGTSFPVKFMANHLCYDRVQQLQAMTMVLLTMPRASQQRSRVHTGAHMECRYKLLSFGIPCDSLPVDFDGNPSRIRHREWLQQRWNMEHASDRQQFMLDSTSMSICSSRKSTESPSVFSSDDDDNTWDGIMPTDTPSAMAPQSSSSFTASRGGGGGGAYTEPSQLDVVFGRGKGFQYHDGNVRFHRLLDIHLKEYDKSSKLEKTRLSESVLKGIQSSSGRFLRQDLQGNWEEVDDNIAREKISRAFRARRSALRANRQS